MITTRAPSSARIANADVRGCARDVYCLEPRVLSIAIATYSIGEAPMPRVEAARAAEWVLDSLAREERAGNRSPVPLATVRGAKSEKPGRAERVFPRRESKRESLACRL